MTSIPILRPEIDVLVKEAMQRFRGMAPEAQARMRRAQRKSWVVGEMMLEHPEMTRAYAEKLYDQITGEQTEETL